jgi:hypothetical protein
MRRFKVDGIKLTTDESEMTKAEKNVHVAI